MTMFWTGAAAKSISTTRCCCARPARFDPPRYLKPGDVVEVEADCQPRNGVVDERT